MENYIDLTLGIDPRAWAVLHLLKSIPPEFAEWDEKNRVRKFHLRTFPWYNGRECGFILTLQAHVMDREALHVAFAEDCRTDKMFVEVWKDKTPFNAPTVETCDADKRDEAYRNRKTFDKADEVTSYILHRFRRYLQEVVR